MKNRIRIARGDISSASNDIKAAEGVPFYDTTNKRLYIGKDNVTPVNQYTKKESPIAFEADHAIDADNAILNSDTTFSGLRKDINNILTTTDNNIVVTKKLLWSSDRPKSNLTGCFKNCDLDNNTIKVGTSQIVATYTGTLNSEGSTITYQDKTYTYSVEYGTNQQGPVGEGFYIDLNDPYGKCLAIDNFATTIDFFILPFRFKDDHVYEIEYDFEGTVFPTRKNIYTFRYKEETFPKSFTLSDFKELYTTRSSSPYRATVKTFPIQMKTPYILYCLCSWEYYIDISSIPEDSEHPASVSIKKYLATNMSTGTGTTITSTPETHDILFTKVYEIIE